jgi:hypothetical protein
MLDIRTIEVLNPVFLGLLRGTSQNVPYSTLYIAFPIKIDRKFKVQYRAYLYDARLGPHRLHRFRNESDPAPALLIRTSKNTISFQQF